MIGRKLFGKLRRPVEVLASARSVIRAAKRLETEMLVGANHVKNVLREAAQ